MRLWPSYESLNHHLPIYLGLQPNRLSSGFATILAHRITAHLKAVSVVNEPVENAVGERWIIVSDWEG